MVLLRVHCEAKLRILCIVSGFRSKDAPFVLLLFFLFLCSFRQSSNMFKGARNIQTQNCAPIQSTVWPRNVYWIASRIPKGGLRGRGIVKGVLYRVVDTRGGLSGKGYC